MGLMNRWGLAAMAAGLLLTGLIISHQDLNGLWSSVSSIGWGIIPVLVVHIIQLVLAGIAWRTPVSCLSTSPGIPFFIHIRWIRESISGLLPITQIGGELISIRLLAIKGMKGSQAGASLVVDLTMEAISLFLFILTGLVVLLMNHDSSGLVKWVLTGLLVIVPAIIGFLLAQRYGMFRLVENFCDWIADHSPLLKTGMAEGLHDTIHALYRDPKALFVSCIQHLLAWAVGTLEVWLILYFLDHPVTLGQALVLESLGQAIRSAVFFIPGGLGVQEGGYLLLGGLAGLSPETGLALSLIKRVRELVIGLPGLLAWQIMEGHHLIVTKAQPVPVTEHHNE